MVVPGQSLAGFELGWSMEQLVARLDGFFEVQESPLGKIVSYRNYRFWISAETLAVEQISAKKGFEGKFMEKVGLGSTLKDLEEHFGGWQEDQDVYLLPDFEGLCFELAEDDELDSEWDAGRMPIEVISVFVPLAQV